MARNYRPKIGGIAHARLPSGAYLEIFRHHLLAQPPTNIASALNLPGPTTRRALSKLQTLMANCPPVAEYMRKMATEVGSQQMAFYERLYAIIWNSYSPGGRAEIDDLTDCLRNCPLGLSPAKFKSKFLEYGSIEIGPYVFVVPRVPDFDAFTKFFLRTTECRFCKAKGPEHSYRANLAGHTQVYLDYMHYLSCRRLRELDRDQSLKMHIDTTTISLLGEIYMQRYLNEFSRTNSHDLARQDLFEYFARTTYEMFEFFENMNADDLQFQ